MLRDVAFAVAAAEALIWEQYPNYDVMWFEYKASFQKKYTEGEDSQRFEAFKASVEEVRSVNSRNLTYTFALTQFSDLLPQEKLTLTGGVKRGRSESLVGETYLGRHVWNGEPLPEAVDWTAHGAVTPAKDQKICGSCWAFSAVASLEGANALATGHLASLSEQQAMQCGSPDGRGCEGGWPDNVFKYASAGKDDLCTEESYPYQGVDTIPCFWNDPEHSSCSAGVAKGQVVGYRDVEQSMEAMMSAVAQQPVSVAVGGSGHWGQYHGGVFTDCDVGVGHAVTVVGYGEEAGGKYWKLKNSWGTSFGIDGGYILIGRDRGVAEGECGLFVHASYPVMASGPAPTPVPPVPAPAPPTPTPVPLPPRPTPVPVPAPPVPMPAPTPSGQCHAISDVVTDDWCDTNCQAGFCPSDLCKCDAMMV